MSTSGESCVFVVEPDPPRRELLVEQLGWRGFRVTGVATLPPDGPPADTTFLVLCGDDPAALVEALPANGRPAVVVCAPADPDALQAALRARVLVWLDRDADAAEIGAPLFEAEDALAAGARAQVLARAFESLPLPVVVSGAEGRVLAASAGAPRARVGAPVEDVTDGGRWTRTPLGGGAELWSSEPEGRSGGDSIRLAEVASLVAQAVHDINNISTYVQNNLATLVDEYAAPDPDGEPMPLPLRLEMLRESLAGAEGATDVVRRLRIAVADRAAGHLGPVELTALVREAAAAVATQHHAVVTVDAPVSVVVRADGARLGRLLGAALLQVAHQSAYVGEGAPPVTATVRVLGDRVLVRMVGVGRGPDERRAAEAFRSFFKDRGAAGPAPWNLAFAGSVLGEIGGDLRFVEEPSTGRWLELTLACDDPVPL